MRALRCLIGVLRMVPFCACLAITPAHAVETVVVQAITRGCVAVGGNGEHGLSLACLNESLREAADTRSTQPHAYDFHDAVGIGSPNTVGIFSFTATGIRMGSNFGHSATPQRPPAPVFITMPVGGK